MKKTLEQLRADRNAAAAKMKAIADLETAGAELTEEQAKEFEAASADFDKLDAQVKRAERTNGVQQRLDEPRPSPGAAQVIGGLAAPGGAGPIHPGGPEAVRTFDTLGDQISAVIRARTGGQVDQRLDYHDFGPMRAATQTMGTGSAGGFMIQENFRGQLLQVDPAQNVLLARVLELAPGAQPDAPTSQPALDQTGNQQGGVTVSRVGEAVAAPETNAELRKVTWTPKEIAAHVPLTNQLMRNWGGSRTVVEVLLQQALAAKREQEIFNGNGATQMMGILNAPCAYDIARTTANTVVYDDIAAMLERLLPRGGEAIWTYSPLLLSKLMKLKDEEGNLIWQNNAREGAPGVLLGKSAFPYEFASALGSRGDLCLLQPNPYYVVQRGSGPFIDVGMINTDFTQRQQRLMISMFDDGQPWLKSKFKLVNDVEVSPFVVLDVPAS